MELETLPTAWSQGVIVNLFKAGDTQLPGITGVTLVSICRKMFTNMLRKRIRSQVHLHEAQAAFKARSCTDNLFVLTHPPRGWQGQQNCLCVLSGRAQSV
jgi:hypothetical protein